MKIVTNLHIEEDSLLSYLCIMSLIKNKQTSIPKKKVAVKLLLHSVRKAQAMEDKKRGTECQSHTLIKYKSKETNLMK